MVVKVNSRRQRRGLISKSLKPISWGAGLAAAALASSTAFAGPEREQVVRGQANFTRDGSHTLIEVSNNAIIQYDRFNIGADESVRFLQPGVSARVLNRIVGAEPTRIDGQLNANGRVYFVNPAGVIFGQNSIVNVGALYAAAGNLADEDFLSGIDRFTNLTGGVENYGRIAGSEVHLLGQYVANHGSIVASEGLITMTSGDEVFIGEEDGHLMLRLKATSELGSSANANAGVTNTGTVEAEGGVVNMGAGDIFGVAIHQSGTVRAERISIDGGEGKVNIAGSIDASNTTAGEVGGSIDITGGTLEVSNATIDASGDAGGGSIRIGGDFHGLGDFPTANVVSLDGDTIVSADALTEGDGGRVIVWADESLEYDAAINVRGGSESGNGGFAEVSSAASMTFTGEFDGTSPGGLAGTLLIDPTDIIIRSGSGGNIADADQFSDAPGTLVIDPLGFGNVSGTLVLQATRNITFENDSSLSGDLVAQAGGSIAINPNVIVSSSEGFIHLEADSPHSPVGASDGAGSIGIADNAGLEAAGDLTLIGTAFFISDLSSVASQFGSINLSLSTSAIFEVGAVNANGIDNDELGVLDPLSGSEVSGTIAIGGAMSAGSDGLGTDSVRLDAAPIKFTAAQFGLNDVYVRSAAQIDDTTTSGANITSDLSLTIDSDNGVGQIDLDLNQDGLGVDVNEITLLGNSDFPFLITGYDLGSALSVTNSELTGLADVTIVHAVGNLDIRDLSTQAGIELYAPNGVIFSDSFLDPGAITPSYIIADARGLGSSLIEAGFNASAGALDLRAGSDGMTVFLGNDHTTTDLTIRAHDNAGFNDYFVAFPNEDGAGFDPGFSEGPLEAFSTITANGLNLTLISETQDVTFSEFSPITLGDGDFTLISESGDIDGIFASVPPDEITTSGSVALIANNIGVTNVVNITGDSNAADDDLFISIGGTGTSRINTTANDFSNVYIESLSASAGLTLNLGPTANFERIYISGGATTATIDALSINQTGFTDISLEDPDAVLFVDPVANNVRSKLRLASYGDVAISAGDETGIGLNLSNSTFDLFLFADSDFDNGGAITIADGGRIALNSSSPGAVRMHAGSGIGSSAVPLEFSNLASFSAATTSGDIYIEDNSGSGAYVETVSGLGKLLPSIAGVETDNAGTIDILISGGNLGANGSPIISSQGGDIFLEGQTLSFTTTSIETRSGGNIDLRSTNGIAAGVVSATDGSGFGGGNIDAFATNGDINIAGNLITSDGGSIGLLSTGGSINTAGISSGNHLSVVAGPGQGGGQIPADNVTISGNLSALGDIVLQAGSLVQVLGNTGLATTDSVTAQGTVLEFRDVTSLGDQTFTGVFNGYGDLLADTGSITFNGDFNGYAADTSAPQTINAGVITGNDFSKVSGAGTDLTLQASSIDINDIGSNGSTWQNITVSGAGVSVNHVNALNDINLSAPVASVGFALEAGNDINASSSTIDGTGSALVIEAGNNIDVGGFTTLIGSNLAITSSTNNVTAGDIGSASNRFGSVAIMAQNDANLNDIYSSGGQTITAGAIAINSEWSNDTAGGIEINGPITLNSDSTISNSASGESVTINGTIDGGHQLVISVPGSVLDINGDIGSNVPLASLDVDASVATLPSITATASIDIAAAGGLSVTGPNVSGDTVTITSPEFALPGPGIDYMFSGMNGVTINGNIGSEDSGNTLLLGSADGLVDVNGNVPAGFNAFTVDADTFELQAVEASQAIDLAAATTGTLTGDLTLNDVADSGTLPRFSISAGSLVLSPADNMITFSTNEATINIDAPITGDASLTLESPAIDLRQAVTLTNTGNTFTADTSGESSTGTINVNGVTTNGSQAYIGLLNVEGGVIQSDTDDISAGDVTGDGLTFIMLGGEVSLSTGSITSNGDISVTAVSGELNTGGENILAAGGNVVLDLAALNAGNVTATDVSGAGGSVNITTHFAALNTGDVTADGLLLLSSDLAGVSTGDLTADNNISVTSNTAVAVGVVESYTSSILMSTSAADADIASNGFNAGANIDINATGSIQVNGDVIATTDIELFAGVDSTDNMMVTGDIDTDGNFHSTAGGTIEVGGTIGLATPDTIILTATTINVSDVNSINDQTFNGVVNASGNFTSSNGSITFNDTLFIVTTDGTSVSAGQNVTGRRVENVTTGAPVSLEAGTLGSGDSSLSFEDIGTLASPFASVNVTGDEVTIFSIGSSGGISITGNNIYAMGSNIRTTGGDININGAIESNLALLNIIADNGDVTFDAITDPLTGLALTVIGDDITAGPIGTTSSRVSSVNITGSTSIDLSSVFTANGQTFTAPLIDAGNSHNNNVTNSIVLNGNLTNNAVTAIENPLGDIQFNGNVNNMPLLVVTGSSVDFAGQIGNLSGFGDLDVAGDTAFAAPVDVDGGIDVTAPSLILITTDLTAGDTIVLDAPVVQFSGSRAITGSGVELTGVINATTIAATLAIDGGAGNIILPAGANTITQPFDLSLATTGDVLLGGAFDLAGFDAQFVTGAAYLTSDTSIVSGSGLSFENASGIFNVPNSGRFDFTLNVSGPSIDLPDLGTLADPLGDVNIMLSSGMDGRVNYSNVYADSLSSLVVSLDPATTNFQGGDIVTEGDINLASDINVLLTDLSITTNGGNVVFNGSIDSAVEAAQSLLINTSGVEGAGDVTLNGDLGSSQPIMSLAVVGDAVQLPAVSTVDAINIDAISSINLHGDLSTSSTTASGLIDLSGPQIILPADTINITATGGDVLLSGTINGEIATESEFSGSSLIVNSSDGDVTSADAINIDSVVIGAAGTINLASVTTSLGQSLSGSAINLSGNLTDTNTGNIDVEGDINLLANTELSTTNGDIDADGEVAGSGFNLTVNANGNDVDFSGPITVRRVTSSGSTQFFANVTTTADQTFIGSLVSNGLFESTASGNVIINGDLTLAGDTTIRTASGPANRIEITGDVSGPFDLTLESGNLDVNNFNDGNGNIESLIFVSDTLLTMNGQINASNVDFAGVTGNVSLLGNTNIASINDVNLGNASGINTDGGGHYLSIDAGTANILLPGVGVMSPIGQLSLTSTGDLTLNGNVQAQLVDASGLGGIVYLGNDVTINVSDGGVDFGAAVGIEGTTTGGQNLAINADAAGSNLPSIGQATPLGSVSVLTSGQSLLGANIFTDAANGNSGNIELTGQILANSSGEHELRSNGGDVDLSGAASVLPASLGVTDLIIDGVDVSLADVGDVEGPFDILRIHSSGTLILAGQLHANLIDTDGVTGDTALAGDTFFFSNGDVNLTEGTGINSIGGPWTLTIDAGNGNIAIGSTGTSSPVREVSLITTGQIGFFSTFVATDLIEINPDGRGSVPSIASSGKIEGALTFVVLNEGGSFVMGQNEKLTVGGHLTIDATNVTLGDLSVLGDLTVSADHVSIQRRPGGVNQTISNIQQDPGVDIVVGRAIAFMGRSNSESPPTFANIGDALGAAPVFANGTGVATGVPNGYEIIRFVNKLRAIDLFNNGSLFDAVASTSPGGDPESQRQPDSHIFDPSSLQPTSESELVTMAELAINAPRIHQWETVTLFDVEVDIEYAGNQIHEASGLEASDLPDLFDDETSQED